MINEQRNTTHGFSGVFCMPEQRLSQFAMHATVEFTLFLVFAQHPLPLLAQNARTDVLL
jgi:hypothetical protein